MGTINQEEQLKRIADTLDEISNSLSSLSLSVSVLEELADCINTYGQLCVTGTITNYEG